MYFISDWKKIQPRHSRANAMHVNQGLHASRSISRSGLKLRRAGLGPTTRTPVSGLRAERAGGGGAVRAVRGQGRPRPHGAPRARAQGAPLDHRQAEVWDSATSLSYSLLFFVLSASLIRVPSFLDLCLFIY